MFFFYSRIGGIFTSSTLWNKKGDKRLRTLVKRQKDQGEGKGGKGEREEKEKKARASMCERLAACALSVGVLETPNSHPCYSHVCHLARMGGSPEGRCGRVALRCNATGAEEGDSVSLLETARVCRRAVSTY